MKNKQNSFQIYLSTILSAFMVMSLELNLIRVQSPYFGNSVQVVGTIIAIFLGYISLGYYLGGILSQKIGWKSQNKLFMINGILLSITVISYKLLIQLLSNYGELLGSIVASIIFGLPVIGLSAIPVLAVKTLANNNSIGITTGKVYAFGTIGSLAGTIITTFILIPFIGTLTTFKILVLLSFIPILLNWKNSHFWIVIVILAVFSIKYTSANVVYQDETVYNNIIVTERNNFTFLVTNKYGYQTIKGPDILAGGIIDYFALGPAITQVDKSLLLGLGGGTVAFQKNKLYPWIEVDAVELDKDIIQVAEKYFDVTENPKLQIHNQDARSYLRQTNTIYDEIDIDVFYGDGVPFHFTTKEFFTEINSKTSDNAIVIMNVVAKPDSEFFNSLTSTALSVFNYGHYFYRPLNTILIFTKNIDSQDMQIRLSTIENPYIKKILENAGQINTIENMNAPILYDDKAPVEFLDRFN